MTAMNVLAWSRITLGAASLLAPQRTGRLFDIDPDTEAAYLARVYGARAIAIGSTWLLGSQEERDRWHHLNLGIDTSDTIAALLAARRGGVPKRAVVALVLLGAYGVTVGVHHAVSQPTAAS